MRDGTIVAGQMAKIETTIAGSREDAFEMLFRSYQRSVYGWILRIVRDPATAEDLTIETFWRIHQALDRYDTSRSFQPWARRIATHVAIDWLRAQHPETNRANDFFTHLPSPELPDPSINAEIRVGVARAFGRLPPKLAAATVLAVVEGLPHKEIAAALGISVAAVKLRVFRALRMLRKDLREQGITP